MSKVDNKEKYVIVNGTGTILEVCDTTLRGLKTICKRLKKQNSTLYILRGMTGWALDVQSYFDDFDSRRLQQNTAKLTIDFAEITMM